MAAKQQELTPELTPEQYQERIRELEAQLTASQAQTRELTAGGEGWLVTCPNPLYDESLHGIQFIKGQAFVRKNQRVPDFEFEPMKPAALQKYVEGQYPSPAYDNAAREKFKAEIRKREAEVTSAMRCVNAFAHDFGYKVEFFDVDRLSELQSRISARVSEYNQTKQMQDMRAQAEMVVKPGYIGQ